MTDNHIDELLQRCSSLPYGPQLNDLLDQALELAEQTQDSQAEYRVRLLQADACAMTGDSTGLLGNFRWCLDRYDQDPQAYPSDPGDGADLLWQYKWMTAVLSADPQIPAEDIHGLLEEMHRHYQRAGIGDSAVLTARFEVAFANGWMEQAAALHALLREDDADKYAHCDACIRSLNMSYLLATGECEQALELLDDLLDNDFSCGQEPANAIAAALIPLLRAGRGKQTKALHVRSYEAARKDPDNLGLVAHHLKYLVVTGNLGRALAVAERHLPWLDHDPMAQREHLDFLGAVGLLCRKATDLGLGEVVVRGSELPEVAEFFGSHDRPVPMNRLAAPAWGAAYDLASRFDVRNGNQWTTERVDAVARLAREDWDLEWDQDSWLPRHEPVGTPLHATDFLRRARERTACGDIEAALTDVHAGLGARPPADVAAGLHQLAMILELGSGRDKSADEQLGHYLRCLKDAGYRSLAAMLGNYGLAIHRDGTREQLSALLHAQDAGHRDLTTLVYIGTWLSHARMRHDQFDLAHICTEGAYLRALELIRCRAGDDVRDSLLHNLYSIRIIQASGAGTVAQLELLLRSWRKYNPTDNSLAQVQYFLAQLAGEAEEPRMALDYATRALAVFNGYQDRHRAILAADFSATLLQESGQVDQAKERLRFGLHQAELAESSQRLALLFRLAQLHLDSGEAHEALDYLTRAQQEAGDLLGGAEQAEIHDLMGEAHGLSQRFQDAAQHWEQATAQFAAAGQGLREMQCAEKLVNVYLLTGAFAAAQTLAERLVPLGDSLRQEHGIQPALNALMLLATVQESMGDRDATHSFTAATELAAEYGQTQLQAQILVKHAQWTGSADHNLGGAVSLMLQAAHLFETVDQESNAAQGIGAAASYLALQERHDEAVLLFEQSLHLPIEEPLAERILRLRLADSLQALDKPEEAANQRALAAQLEDQA